MIETEPFLLSEALVGVRISKSDMKARMKPLATVVTVWVGAWVVLAFLLIFINAPEVLIIHLPVLLVFPMFFLFSHVSRLHQKRTIDRIPTLTSPARAIFDEVGVRFRSDLMDCFVSWHGLFSFLEDSKTLLFYLGPSGGVYAVPKAQLGSDEAERLKAVTQIRAWIDANGVKIDEVATPARP